MKQIYKTQPNNAMRILPDLTVNAAAFNAFLLISSFSLYLNAY
jgi:hypothetical protein